METRSRERGSPSQGEPDGPVSPRGPCNTEATPARGFWACFVLPRQAPWQVHRCPAPKEPRSQVCSRPFLCPTGPRSCGLSSGATQPRTLCSSHCSLGDTPQSDRAICLLLLVCHPRSNIKLPGGKAPSVWLPVVSSVPMTSLAQPGSSLIAVGQMTDCGRSERHRPARTSCTQASQKPVGLCCVSRPRGRAECWVFEVTRPRRRSQSARMLLAVPQAHLAPRPLSLHTYCSLCLHSPSLGPPTPAQPLDLMPVPFLSSSTLGRALQGGPPPALTA